MLKHEIKHHMPLVARSRPKAPQQKAIRSSKHDAMNDLTTHPNEHFCVNFKYFIPMSNFIF